MYTPQPPATPLPLPSDCCIGTEHVRVSSPAFEIVNGTKLERLEISKGVERKEQQVTRTASFT